MYKKSTELSVELRVDMSDVSDGLHDLISALEEIEKDRAEAVAHINRMKEEWEKNDANNVSTEEKLGLIVDLLYGEPPKILAKRDITGQKEALEWFDQRQAAADKLRQQSQEISK